MMGYIDVNHRETEWGGICSFVEEDPHIQGNKNITAKRCLDKPTVTVDSYKDALLECILIEDCHCVILKSKFV